MMVNCSGMTRGPPNIHVGEREITSQLNMNPEEERSVKRPGQKYENNNEINVKTYPSSADSLDQEAP
jgi:hypothetical protein